MKNAYSPIDRLAAELTRPKGTGAEFMTELSKKPGYKQAEVEDRELQTLMALPKMAREDFLRELRAKRAVKPQERVLSGEAFPEGLSYAEMREREASGVDQDAAHHEKYTLPGGENYREILLKHPKGGMFEGVPGHFGEEPDILASIRVKDRTGPNGEKILHLEEIQSDWHQQGREKGYLPKNHQEQIEKMWQQAKQAEAAHKKVRDEWEKSRDWRDLLSHRLESLDPEDSSVYTPRRAEIESQLRFHNDKVMDLSPEVMKADEAHRQAKKEYHEVMSRTGVPDAPFKKNWHELALKRMIQHAAENGYDQIAITPGEEQAKRYKLSQHVGTVSYNPDEQHFQAFKPNRETLINEKGASPERVAELIGKDAATRLMAAPKQMGHHSLEGENLDVGGEGMKGFYDKMVPKFLNQFGKKYGAQVGTVDLPHSSNNQALRQLGGYPPAPMATLHSFPITPEMREDVTKNGIPLYAKGGEVDREEGLRKFLEPSVEKRRMYHGTRHQQKSAGPYTMGDVMEHHGLSDTEWANKDFGEKEALMAQFESHRNSKNDVEKIRRQGGFSSIKPGARKMAFVSPDPKFASDYAGDYRQADQMSGTVYPVHVQVKNPFDYENFLHVEAVVDAMGKTRNKWSPLYGKTKHEIENILYTGDWEAIEDPIVQAAAKKLGHDAMYMREAGVKNLGIFNPNVIKSATGNRGTYDISKPHMNKAKGGEVEVRPTVKDETIQRKIPEMEAAAKALQAGIIDRKEYDRTVKKHKPVKPYDFVPQPASDEDADRALMINKKPHWRGHEQWPAGRKVGLRLDIPAYEQHGVWVNSIHDEEGREGDKLKTSYAPVSSVKNATFDAGPEKAIKVATGEQNKSPFARIKGELHHMTEDEAVEHMKEHLNNPEYAQVGMDPRRHGFFYDRKTMKPVTHSEHVVQIGPLVLAKNPKYGKRETYATGGSVATWRTAEPHPENDLLQPIGASKMVGDEKLLSQDDTFSHGLSEFPSKNKSYRYLYHDEDKNPIGAMQIKTSGPRSKNAVIQNLYVSENNRRQGIASKLLKRARQDFNVKHSTDLTSAGRAFAKVVKAEGGAVKPAVHGIIKERVTVSPDKDVMMYELMSAKHFTKKVKR